MSGPILLLLKASLLLAAALLAARWLARESAGRRHLLWSGAFIALILLPTLAIVLPPIEILIPKRAVERVAPLLTNEQAVAPPVVDNVKPSPLATASIPDVPQMETRRPFVLPSLGMIWVMGFALAIVALAVSLVRVKLLERRGRLIGDPAWWSAAGDIARQLGYNQAVRLIVADGVTTPMAAGVVHPTVFLPADAPTWSPERRDMVLAHEIAHLASRDPLRHLMGRAALTLYWFHPLAWLAARDANTACEQACDEAVLSLGVRPSDYAQVLLDFAGGAPAAASAAALPIVRRPLLETRLMAILEGTPRRPARRMLLPTFAGVALTLCIAAARPGSAPVAAPLEASVVAAPATPMPTAGKSALIVSPTTTTVIPVSKSTPQVQVTAPECGSGWNTGSSSTINSRNGQTVYRVIHRTFSDLRVCAIGEDLDDREPRPSRWSGATRMVLETEERSGDLRRMEVVRGVTTYSVNGRPAPINEEVQAWRRSLLAVLDAMSEASEIRGQVSSLRGEISSTYGERSSLMGEISSLRGQVSSMQGEISSIRGEESSMRGEISSIRGHQSSLQGQISSERGAISSLQASRNDRYSDRDAIDRAIRRHEDEIARIEAEIARYDVEGRVREVERRIANFDADARVREVERRIRNFDVEAQVREVQRRLDRLDVDGHVSSIEREIAGMDADARVAAIEARQNAALQDLRARLRR